ncbi:MAG: hypothetical protein ACRCVS_01360 [Fusobacteriaceae bacterium]
MKKIAILLTIMFLSGCSFLSKTPKEKYKFTSNQYNTLEIRYRQILSNKFKNRDIKRIQNKYKELLEILDEILEINYGKKAELSLEFEKQVSNLKVEVMYKIQILDDLKD